MSPWLMALRVTPSRTRTLVKSTLLINSSPWRAFSAARHALGVEAPQQVVTLLMLLDHGPVPAARQHGHPRPPDALADLPHRLRGGDRVLVAGDQQRRALDADHLRRLRVGQGLAGSGVTGRALPPDPPA